MLPASSLPNTTGKLCLIMMHTCIGTSVVSVESLPTDLCVMRAIGILEKKEILLDRHNTSEDKNLPTAVSSARIRMFWHTLMDNARTQARSRTLMEDMMQMASDCLAPGVDNSTILTSDAIENMLDFAECQNLTEAINCGLVLSVNQFRTADGTCNNLENPLWGASNTAFSRLGPAAYEDGMQVPVGYSQQNSDDPFGTGWPSARHISQKIARDLPPVAPFSHLLTSYSQFVAHDLDLMGEFDTTACEETCDLTEFSSFCYPIRVRPGDPVYGRSGQNMGECLPLTRSVGECIQPSGNNSVFTMPRQQINQVTHYLDGSAVYGSTAQVMAGLRSFQCGQMKVSQRSFINKGDPPFIFGGFLSPQGTPFFAFGDLRGNSITPLIALQALFIREHNRLARAFASMNPCWGDERIFQEARKIVGALVQIFTYEEMLPLVYGDTDVFNKYIGPYKGYDSKVRGIVHNEFANAGLRFGHSLLSDSFARLDSDGNPLPIGPLGLRESFINTLQYFISGGTDPLLRGYLQDQSRASDEFMNRVFTSQFNAPTEDSLGQDVASRDIQRGREHGFQPYRFYAKLCEERYGVAPTFSRSSTRSLRQVYGRRAFNNAMDLYMASLAEEHLEDSNIGPTHACILAITFNDLRTGDRFWWENPGIFTECQRDSLSKIRISKLICDNAENIPMIRANAFQPGGLQQNCNELSALNLTLWKDDSCGGEEANRGLCM